MNGLFPTKRGTLESWWERERTIFERSVWQIEEHLTIYRKNKIKKFRERILLKITHPKKWGKYKHGICPITSQVILFSKTVVTHQFKCY